MEAETVFSLWKGLLFGHDVIYLNYFEDFVNYYLDCCDF